MSHSPSASSENYLKSLYVRQVEGEKTDLPHPDDQAIGELLRTHLIRAEGKAYALTHEGQQQAARVVRRHRLAERLLHDVITVHGSMIHEAACQFEHSLHHGIEEQVCALLGHPKTCPHGRNIPPGKCCRDRRKAIPSAISMLSEMKAGERGVIAYLCNRRLDIVRKIMALGLVPGAPVRLVQTFPGVVLQTGHTQLAVDKELAADIFVRRAGD